MRKNEDQKTTTPAKRWVDDLVILDECHKVSNSHAAVTRRMKRYLEANPQVTVVALSGALPKDPLKNGTPQWPVKSYTAITPDIVDPSTTL
jgi:hypothetical protein